MLVIIRSNYDAVLDALTSGFEECGFDPGSRKVLIKPNIVSPHKPTVGATTHPAVIEALLVYFGGRRCILAESCVVGVDTDETFEKTGLAKLAAKHGAELVNLQRASRVTKAWKFGELSLPNLLFECAYINVAKLKTHILTGVTLCLKNQKGVLADADKMRFHRIGVDRAIPALYDVLKPDFAIIDGIWALEGEGPGKFGERRDLGLLLMGNDALEVDNLGLQVMGFEPGEIAHIPDAHLGEIRGEPLSNVRAKFKRSKGYYKKANTFYYPCGACSGCSNAIAEAMKSLISKPWKHPLKVVKFALHGIIGKRFFVAGVDAKFPEGRGAVVCIGNCSAKFAGENSLKLVRGCPPAAADIIDVL